MTRSFGDGCGCFPTGRHYAGIAHLLRTVVRGVVEGISPDVPWQEIEIALLDVETTGRDASVDRVVEVGVVVGRGGEILRKDNWLINPGIPIPPEVSAIHHITNEMVKDAPRFEDVAAEIAGALRGAVPAAYNAPFDRAFMMSEFSRAQADTSSIGALARDVEWIDPLIWARHIQADEKSRALGDVAARLGVSLENAHRAEDDAAAALRVLYALGRNPRVPRAYGALLQQQRSLAQSQAAARRTWR
ncbi:MAG: 3'-5' exonuclease [Polyangiaceae bacterium]|nr:3'-5' exonuclease [Polyangiaceae bacterium]